MSHDNEIDEADYVTTSFLKTKRKSLQEKPTNSPIIKKESRLSIPRLDAPRISITAPRLSLTPVKDPLLDAMHRSIEIDKLEKYILGKKSVELEIEFGISRHQLCR